MLLLMKIGRIANDPKNIDSWIDVCGYGGCCGESGEGRFKEMAGRKM